MRCGYLSENHRRRNVTAIPRLSKSSMAVKNLEASKLRGFRNFCASLKMPARRHWVEIGQKAAPKVAARESRQIPDFLSLAVGPQS